MPIITSSKTKPAYDVIIVGSGAAGGQSAYVLAMAGAKVLMLEAGRNYDPVLETPMFSIPKQAPLRGAGTPDKPFGFYDATVDGGWTVPREPYLVRRSRRGNGWYEATDVSLAATRPEFHVVARTHVGRAHQSLGPNRPANGAPRFQAAQPRRARH